jgi:hypothetical protein
MGAYKTKFIKILLAAFQWLHHPAGKTARKPILTVPLHQLVDKPEMQPVIALAADRIVKSRLLRKWVRYDGSLRLCQWDASQQLFLRGTVEDWIKFIGLTLTTSSIANRR